MLKFDVNKNKESVTQTISNINKICGLVNTEDITPEFVMANEIGTNVTKNTYLCPCGVLTTIESRQDVLEKEHTMSISSNKCGL